MSSAFQRKDVVNAAQNIDRLVNSDIQSKTTLRTEQSVQFSN